MILLDTSGLFAALDKAHALQRLAAETLSLPQPRILSPFVLAELDYLVSTRMGVQAEARLLAEVSRGIYRIESFSAADIDNARALILQYADLGIGLADASLVILARRFGCSDILTLDERHFRVLPGPEGRPFRLLPADR